MTPAEIERMNAISVSMMLLCCLNDAGSIVAMYLRPIFSSILITKFRSFSFLHSLTLLKPILPDNFILDAKRGSTVVLPLVI